MTNQKIKGFVIAGERSGVGKTILTMALAKAFMRRGMNVQCFKVGPDFIDPSFHLAVTGQTSRNLDGWMMGKNYCVQSFHDNSKDADMVIVEGVMGLFDGYDGKSEDGSTAQIAKWLNLPIVLIVDGSSFARTAGALVLGYEMFDDDIKIAGVIFNRVAGERHFEYIRDGVNEKCSTDVLGYVPRDPAWSIPERHLGLVMADEQKNLIETVESISLEIEKTVNVERLIKLCEKAGPIDIESKASDDIIAPERSVTIGIARDEAFCFYYQDNIELLERYGAKIEYFSPIHDKALPDGLNGLYLGGGYPELYAESLSRNNKMREDVLFFCKSGRPVYAECGGFLYLLQAITDLHGNRYPMTGLFPSEAKMLPHLKRLGYVEVETVNGRSFLPEGVKMRGHEFHYSEIAEMPVEIDRCFKVSRRRGRDSFLEGYCINNVLAGYLHLHFASNIDFVKKFVRMGGF
jgi:cobyrinic acid a,c-diamide synthase